MLHCALALAFLLVGVGSTFAADASKSNTLSPQEIRDGWLLLFDGQTLFGWTSADLAKWTVKDGHLSPQNNAPPLVTTSAFADYELSVEYQQKKAMSHVLLGCEAHGQKTPPEGKIPLLGGTRGWWRLTVTVVGGLVKNEAFESVEGTQGAGRARTGLLDKSDALVRNHLALTAGNEVIFRSIKLRPLGEKPLFTGKDLSGWKEFPGRKSKFTVTSEGWLNIKNGPGDLQTEGQWANFILQLECMSNGKHLNSGVFFRCRPGEYQQGYEAQIHNGWLENATKSYKVQEYDPKTHKPTAEKVLLSAAMDYGTGAIYRRIPARQAVARDKEWFTLTVLADGRHLATWVNGLQVVDWTDHRPLGENARTACRLEKGPISLQGHDQTTDLSFRALRLVELPPAARQ